jgi:hypothetical protein
MSIFGKLDAQNIPANPFWIEKGEYKAEITKAAYQTNRDQKRQLIIEFTINDENSQFLDSKATKYFDLVDPEMTAEQMALLPAEEQKTIRRNLSSLKNALCGSGRNKGLGVNPDDLNDDTWDPAVLMGTKVDLAISNYGPTNDGVNVRWANIQE